MSFRFVFGPSGSGKSSCLRKEILERADADLKSLHFSSYLYIVPEQFTMQTQKDLVLGGESHGIMNVDVLSFGRLAHRIFEEVGELSPEVLDDTGKSLIVRRLASARSADLEILGRQASSPGMIDEIKSIISEFMQYDISADMVEELAAFAAERGQFNLRARLEDMKILYEDFLKYREGKFATREDLLDILAADVAKSKLIADSVIVFDGFTGFTPIQYRVLDAVLANAKEVIFCLTIGEDGDPGAIETLDPKTPISSEALFYLTRRTVREIVLRAEKLGVPAGVSIDLGQQSVPGRFAANRCLGHLEKSLYRGTAMPFRDPCSAITLFSAANPAAEAGSVCERIGELLRQGYACRDIGVVCADLDAYAEAMEQAGLRYDLPVYVDRTSHVGQNPMTEAVLSGLEAVEKGLDQEAVFRFLKSGMSLLGTEKTSRLENYCIAHGISGRKRFETFFEDENEEARREVLRELEPLMQAGESAGAKVRALYAFITGLSMQEQLEQQATLFGAGNDPVRQMEFLQLYPAFMDLLDQIDSLLGDERISRKDFRELIKTGIGEIQLGTLPQRVDRILVGDLERTRLSELKVLFVLGVNDTLIPKPQSGSGIISDLDREFLLDSRIELAPTPKQLAYQQRLYIYLAFTKPKDRLILSYAKTDAQGKSLRPSHLVRDLKRLFPGLAEEAGSEAAALQNIYGTKDGLKKIAAGLNRFAQDTYRKDKPAEEEAALLSVYRLLAEGEPAVRKRLFALRDAAFLRYRGEPLSKESAKALYGQVLFGSVSRLETAAQCYMRQFLTYGLRLRERKRADFAPADYGTILHASVERFGRELMRENLPFSGADPKATREILHRALIDTMNDYSSRYAPDDSRVLFRLRRMEEELGVTVAALQYQVSRGSFEPAAYEVSFGDDQAFGYDLSDGRRVCLHGKIDRIDVAREDGKTFVKVIDYKSGKKDIKEEQIERGLQLQLPLYTSVACTLVPDADGREAEPAAMFYNRFEDPFFTGGDALMPDGVTSERELQNRLSEKQRERLVPKGLANGDPQVLSLLDHAPEEKPAVTPVRRKKDGGFVKGAPVFDEEGYRSIIEKTEKGIRRMAEAILDGETKANPVRYDDQRSACTYCPYTEGCIFDTKTPGCRYSEA